MNFKRENIKSKYIWIVDIWTFKVRVWICKILNRDVELIWYWEKRQNTNDINLQEITDLGSVCYTISQAIEKAQNDAKIKISDYIINIPSQDLFFESSKVNYSREETQANITEEENYKILKEIEVKAFKSNYKKIKENSWFSKNDLRLIISNFSNIKADGQSVKAITWLNPKEINISILNIFLTEKKFELKNYISKYLWKNIVNIIPTEFALLWLFNEVKNVVIIDLWNSHTSIIVKKDNYVLWSKKLAFWINDLIKQIRWSYNLTRNDIVKKIDDDIFEAEKNDFLDIFKDILSITLDEILKKGICPDNFSMIWWWANKFVKDFLSNTTFDNNELKLAKKIKFISPKIDFIDDKITENPEWIDWAKSNINIYAMIKTTLDFIKKDKNKLERTIKQIVEEIN